MKKIISLSLVAFALSFSSHAHAFFTPLSLNLAPPVEFPPEEYSVTGLRLSVLWGKHRDLYGLDVGLLGNMTNNTFVGSAVSGVFNLTSGTTTVVGVQFAGITNINTNKTDVYGVQATLGMNIQQASSSINGLQLGLVGNLCPFTDINGLQVGLYNDAQEVRGIQVGLVNKAKSLHGLQIGLVNFNNTGPFAISPFLNIGF